MKTIAILLFIVFSIYVIVDAQGLYGSTENPHRQRSQYSLHYSTAGGNRDTHHYGTTGHRYNSSPRPH